MDGSVCLPQPARSDQGQFPVKNCDRKSRNLMYLPIVASCCLTIKGCALKSLKSDPVSVGSMLWFFRGAIIAFSFLNRIIVVAGKEGEIGNYSQTIFLYCLSSGPANVGDSQGREQINPLLLGVKQRLFRRYRGSQLDPIRVVQQMKVHFCHQSCGHNFP